MKTIMMIFRLILLWAGLILVNVNVDKAFESKALGGFAMGVVFILAWGFIFLGAGIQELIEKIKE